MFDSRVSKITPQAMSRTLALFILKLFYCSSSSLWRDLGVDSYKQVKNRNPGHEVKCIKHKRCRKVVSTQVIIFLVSWGCVVFPCFLKGDINKQSASSPYFFFFKERYFGFLHLVLERIWNLYVAGVYNFSLGGRYDRFIY